MKTRLIHSSLTLGLVIGLVSFSTSARAQETTKNVTVKGEKGRGAADASDPNIKQARQPNDPGANSDAPPDKGGPKTRGVICHIHIDNRTAYYVEIYIDGRYRGEVSPWGDSTGSAICGETNFYGVARFTDGTKYTWGPTVYDIDGRFTWTITR